MVSLQSPPLVPLLIASKDTGIQDLLDGATHHVLTIIQSTHNKRQLDVMQLVQYHLGNNNSEVSLFCCSFNRQWLPQYSIVNLIHVEAFMYQVNKVEKKYIDQLTVRTQSLYLTLYYAECQKNKTHYYISVFYLFSKYVSTTFSPSLSTVNVQFILMKATFAYIHIAIMNKHTWYHTLFSANRYT